MKFMWTLFVAAVIAGISSFAIGKNQPRSSDADFLDQFSEHHQDAIKMGEIALTKAKDSEVKQMAGKMVSDQKKEIAQMKKWREELYPSAAKTEGGMPKMDMSGLRTKTGRDFDIAFLDMMAKHHKQGVDMAKSAAGKLSNQQVKTFAENAAEKQDDERKHLEEMKKSELTKAE